MKTLDTAQKNELRKARAILANVINDRFWEIDELTKEPKTINCLLVDAENIISEVNEQDAHK